MSNKEEAFKKMSSLFTNIKDEDAIKWIVMHFRKWFNLVQRGYSFKALSGRMKTDFEEDYIEEEFENAFEEYKENPAFFNLVLAEKEEEEKPKETVVEVIPTPTLEERIWSNDEGFKRRQKTKKKTLSDIYKHLTDDDDESGDPFL